MGRSQKNVGKVEKATLGACVWFIPSLPWYRDRRVVETLSKSVDKYIYICISILVKFDVLVGFPLYDLKVDVRVNGCQRLMCCWSTT